MDALKGLGGARGREQFLAGVDRRSPELKTRYQATGFLARTRLAGRGMTVAEDVGKRVEIID